MKQNADIRMLRHEALAKITREDSYSKLAIEWVNQKTVELDLSLES